MTNIYYLAETNDIQGTLDLDNCYNLEQLCDIAFDIADTKPYSLDEAKNLLGNFGYTVMELE